MLHGVSQYGWAAREPATEGKQRAPPKASRADTADAVVDVWDRVGSNPRKNQHEIRVLPYFTLQEHLSGRKWSTSMGDFLCPVGSPGRLTYVFNCIHHVCACLCHVQPILNDVKGSPSMAKMPTLKRSIFFVEQRRNATVAADYRSFLGRIVWSVRGIWSVCSTVGMLGPFLINHGWVQGDQGTPST